MRHHGSVGNLDKRGVGDVWTMTKEEYRASNKLKRLKYRIYRNPLVMFGIGSLYVFLIQNRLTRKGMTRKEIANVWFTNAALFLLLSLWVWQLALAPS